MLKLTFHIRRKKFYYVVSIYIPTILITILSWVSFWIPRSSPPARVALGITTVLALTTLIFGIQSSMPKVSYVKAIDWFLCVSFLYVFAALVEYPSSTFVKSQAKKLSRKGTTILRKVKGLKEDPEDVPLSGTRYGSTDKPRVSTMGGWGVSKVINGLTQVTMVDIEWGGSAEINFIIIISGGAVV